MVDFGARGFRFGLRALVLEACLPEDLDGSRDVYDLVAAVGMWHGGCEVASGHVGH